MRASFNGAHSAIGSHPWGSVPSQAKLGRCECFWGKASGSLRGLGFKGSGFRVLGV